MRIRIVTEPPNQAQDWPIKDPLGAIARASDDVFDVAGLQSRQARGFLEDLGGIDFAQS